MLRARKKHATLSLPAYFKPLFWSYKFAALDLERNKKMIIAQTINYGDLRHWRWLKKRYGKDVVRAALASLRPGAIKKRALLLARLIF